MHHRTCKALLKMNTTINEIESELTNAIKKFGTDNEQVFNLGVKLGRELERTNKPDYRLAIFSEIEAKKDISEQARQLKNSIEKLLLSRVKLAVTEIINTDYDWTVGVGSYYYGDGKFSDGIVKKYSVEFESISQPNTDGHFETYFSIEGKLLQCFEEYGCTPRLEVTLDNDSGEDHVSLNSEDDVGHLYGPYLHMPVPSTEEELEKLIKLKSSLEKVLMFNIIGGS